MFWKLLILLSLVGTAVCLMCYQCADTSRDEGKNDCQTYVRTMRKKQRLFWESLDQDLSYVKNCSNFGNLTEEATYCYIGSVRQSGTGEVRSYIRDCNDGTTFFGAEFNNLFQSGNVIGDNQTTCMYSPQGFLACVTLCGPNQDFCNGPTLSANSNSMSVILLIAAIIFNLINIK